MVVPNTATMVVMVAALHSSLGATSASATSDQEIWTANTTPT